MSSDPVTAGFDFGTALLMLIKGTIPQTKEELECLQHYFPAIAERRKLRAQKIKEKEINQAVEYVSKHNLDPFEFALYAAGDSTFADLVKQSSAKIKK